MRMKIPNLHINREVDSIVLEGLVKVILSLINGYILRFQLDFPTSESMRLVTSKCKKAKITVLG